MTSQLSPGLSPLSEMVVGVDPSNSFDIDLERYQLTYNVSRYFEISAGRHHTAIGDHNTAYHRGV